MADDGWKSVRVVQSQLLLHDLKMAYLAAKEEGVDGAQAAAAILEAAARVPRPNTRARVSVSDSDNSDEGSDMDESDGGSVADDAVEQSSSDNDDDDAEEVDE
jgi:hypothetical protein